MKIRLALAILAAGSAVLLACARGPTTPPRSTGDLPRPHEDSGSREPASHAAQHPGQHLQPPVEHEADTPPIEIPSRLKRGQLREYGDTVHQARSELVSPSTGKVDTSHCAAHSDNMACYEEDHLIPLEEGGDPTDSRNLWPEPYNTRVGETIMGAHQKDVVEAFVHDEVCFGIRGAKQSSYIPAATSITLRRGQEIVAVDWYACYESIRRGEPCK
jgi:hypothetical protein